MDHNEGKWRKQVYIGIGVGIVVCVVIIASFMRSSTFIFFGQANTLTPITSSTQIQTETPYGATQTPVLPTVTPEPPTPTSLPLKPGTVLYKADWSHGLNGWTGTTEWKTLNGMLLSDDTQCCDIFAPYQPVTADYAIEARWQLISAGNGGHATIFFRVSDDPTGPLGYEAGTDVMYSQGQGKISANAVISYDCDCPDLVQVAYAPNTAWHTYRIEVKGNQLKLFIDGTLVVQVQDNKYLDAGRIGLSEGGDNLQMNVSSFVVTSL